MASNFSKLWIQRKLNEAAILRAKEEIFATGWALPCRVVAVSGSIVTVAFEVDSSPWTLPQITIPKAESNWIRMPTQIGDFGYTVPADVHLGQISGLGTGTPKITTSPANLSGLVFHPVSNKNAPPSDPNAAIVQGPNGAIIQTTAGTASSIVTNASGTTITYGSVTVVVNASGVTITASDVTVDAATTTINGTLTVTGSVTASDLVAGNISFNSHYHGGVTTGSGNTSGPA